MSQDISETSATVTVGLGERAYDILIGSGLIEAAGLEIATRLPGSRVAVITDETVAGIHLDRLKNSLGEAGIAHESLVLPAGEKTKSFPYFEKAVDFVLAGRFERGDAVVALGGGVIGDLTGFVAGVIRRGMQFVQIPTTLLSQVDSSVGGKTGINSDHGKNLIGVFHQPRLVLADTDVLDTLESSALRDLRKEDRPQLAELERLVGKQQALISFFEHALQQVEAGTAGKAASTKPSGKSANERERR